MKKKIFLFRKSALWKNLGTPRGTLEIPSCTDEVKIFPTIDKSNPN